MFRVSKLENVEAASNPDPSEDKVEADIPNENVKTSWNTAYLCNLQVNKLMQISEWEIKIVPHLGLKIELQIILRKAYYILIHNVEYIYFLAFLLNFILFSKQFKLQE